jgi:cytosine/adenosine deaminase-related metal-dependent hydrolase
MHPFFNSSLAVGLTSLLAGASPAGATAGICDAIAGNSLLGLTGLGFAAYRQRPRAVKNSKV